MIPSLRAHARTRTHACIWVLNFSCCLSEVSFYDIHKIRIEFIGVAKLGGPSAYYVNKILRQLFERAIYSISLMAFIDLENK